MNIPADKEALRKASFARRKPAHESVNASPGRARLLQHVTSIPALEIISGYAPIRTEIDPMPVLRLLSGMGYRICLPVVGRMGQPLTFRAWTPDTDMVPGAFGAPIPDTDEMLEPELLITPLLAFDRLGYRLGYGGGFYDRTLERLKARRRTWAVGFAYAAQEVEQVPREATDQPLDAVVTEAETILTS